MHTEKRTVVVIGAGPSGALVSALMKKQGRDVVVLERDRFPRFSIGESLLPQCMAFMEQAGLLNAVEQGGYQHKNGAAFAWGQRYTEFDFREKFSPGPGTTYQVPRADFDKRLADAAEAQGVEIRYGHTLVGVTLQQKGAQLCVEADGQSYRIECDFVLDASGFGRVLPKLLKLERPSDFPSRRAIFTHIQDNAEGRFDRNKILITVHPEHQDLWFWLIPFSDGRASLGVVGEEHFFKEGVPWEEQLKAWVAATPSLASVLTDSQFDRPVQSLKGYSADVTTLADPRFALLGNAGEFLDPVFSSGVTIAMKSAVLAAQVLGEQLEGNTVDWQQQYARPLQQGVNTFKTYVKAWYRGDFQTLMFHPNPNSDIRDMVSAILAGYAWDEANPLVRESDRRLAALVALCQ
ncbi:NAD(P)/FAD-dependent oxidoreductase [Ferrimonas futtsuensis]|uniref:NAD(P)/FAD-dependent oxidoreductase n=1 Tax=Ferrimonas futtsuensis TaxID=364764 RepID=UPI0003F9B3E9|nr:NAD(P)/FAD-dependent oxidoreductase [Ferrimonas futtsuensis]